MKIEIQKILCPVDFSENSRYALKYAIAFAQAHNAELTLMHVSELPVVASLEYPLMPELIAKISENSETELRKLYEEIVKEHDRLETYHTTGTIFVEIIKYAREQQTDLIVMGTHGTQGLVHALMGDVSEKVVRKAPCPVLSIRHPEHEFIMP